MNQMYKIFSTLLVTSFATAESLFIIHKFNNIKNEELSALNTIKEIKTSDLIIQGGGGGAGEEDVSPYKIKIAQTAWEETISSWNSSNIMEMWGSTKSELGINYTDNLDNLWQYTNSLFNKNYDGYSNNPIILQASYFALGSIIDVMSYIDVKSEENTYTAVGNLIFAVKEIRRKLSGFYQTAKGGGGGGGYILLKDGSSVNSYAFGGGGNGCNGGSIAGESGRSEDSIGGSSGKSAGGRYTKWAEGDVLNGTVPNARLFSIEKNLYIDDTLGVAPLSSISSYIDYDFGEFDVQRGGDSGYGPGGRGGSANFKLNKDMKLNSLQIISGQNGSGSNGGRGGDAAFSTEGILDAKTIILDQYIKEYDQTVSPDSGSVSFAVKTLNVDSGYELLVSRGSYGNNGKITLDIQNFNFVLPTQNLDTALLTSEYDFSEFDFNGKINLDLSNIDSLSLYDTFTLIDFTNSNMKFSSKTLNNVQATDNNKNIITFGITLDGKQLKATVLEIPPHDIADYQYSESPGYSPEYPDYQPEKPGYQPEKPSTPEDQYPKSPDYRPEHPGYKPEKPSSPGDQYPESPDYRPEHPGYKPEKPSTPGDQYPESPDYRPEHPDYKPQKPSTPGDQYPESSDYGPAYPEDTPNDYSSDYSGSPSNPKEPFIWPYYNDLKTVKDALDDAIA